MSILINRRILNWWRLCIQAILQKWSASFWIRSILNAWIFPDLLHFHFVSFIYVPLCGHNFKMLVFSFFSLFLAEILLICFMTMWVKCESPVAWCFKLVLAVFKVPKMNYYVWSGNPRYLVLIILNNFLIVF